MKMQSPNKMMKEAKWKAIFSHLDKDKSGSITAQELSKGFFGIIPAKQLESVIKMLDKDKDGKISYNEFKNVMKKLDGGKKKW